MDVVVNTRLRTDPFTSLCDTSAPGRQVAPLIDDARKTTAHTHTVVTRAKIQNSPVRTVPVLRRRAPHTVFENTRVCSWFAWCGPVRFGAYWFLARGPTFAAGAILTHAVCHWCAHGPPSIGSGC